MTCAHRLARVVDSDKFVCLRCWEVQPLSFFVAVAVWADLNRGTVTDRLLKRRLQERR